MWRSQSGLSRRGFMGSVGVGGLALGALARSAGAQGAAPMIDVDLVTTPVTDVEKLPDAYYLTNVRLETGFVEERKPWLDAPVITHTRTELKTLRIADGKIAEILDAKMAVPPDAAAFDAQGQLMLPTFRDMHIHLDKTFYGGPWQATLPTEHGRADRVAQERELLPELLPLAQDRTAAMIRLMQSQGSLLTGSWEADMARTPGLFDMDEGLRRLSDIGDQLEAFAAVTNFEVFRPELDATPPMATAPKAGGRRSIRS